MTLPGNSEYTDQQYTESYPHAEFWSSFLIFQGCFPDPLLGFLPIPRQSLRTHLALIFGIGSYHGITYAYPPIMEGRLYEQPLVGFVDCPTFLAAQAT